MEVVKAHPGTMSWGNPTPVPILEFMDSDVPSRRCVLLSSQAAERNDIEVQHALDRQIDMIAGLPESALRGLPMR